MDLEPTDSAPTVAMTTILRELGQVDPSGSPTKAFTQAFFTFWNTYTTVSRRQAADISKKDQEEIRLFCYHFLSEECGDNGKRFWGPGAASFASSPLYYPENFERYTHAMTISKPKVLQKHQPTFSY